MLRTAEFWGSLLLLYTVVVGLVFAFQRSLMYFPQRLTPTEFAEQVRQLPGRAQVLDPFDAIVLSPDSGQAPRGVAIWFHGNAGNALTRRIFAPPFLGRGFRLVLAEYPGYGPRPGSPSEEVLVEDALALTAAVQARYPGAALTLVGESLGSGVAVQVAARQPAGAVSRLVLLTPYASLREVAAQKFPALPARHLLIDQFNSADHIEGYRGLVTALIAGRDEVIGAEQGRKLVERARGRGPVRLVEMPDDGHMSWNGAITASQWDELLLSTQADPPTPGP